MNRRTAHDETHSDLAKGYEPGGSSRGSAEAREADRAAAARRRRWTGSRAGEPVSSLETERLIETTADRVLASAPSRVLEIGCGTGALLGRIGRRCSEYVGTDVSQDALDAVRRGLLEPSLVDADVTLLRGAADVSSFEPGSFDAVVVNAPAVRLADAASLPRLLEGAVRAVTRGGSVFVCDLTSPSLVEARHAADVAWHAPASMPVEQLRWRVRSLVRNEKSLAVEPALFEELPGLLPDVASVEILLKRGPYRNETSAFYYDVAIHAGASEPGLETVHLDWHGDHLALFEVRDYLLEQRPAALAVRCVPNDRLLAEGKLVATLRSSSCPRTVGDLRHAVDAALPHVGIEPEQFWELGEELGYRVAVGWSASGRVEECDALFTRHGEA